jgi:methylenetetrahydrofolate--tRNA-(uracil-5-)-methyltransferase
MPIEEMARRGSQTLTYGPLKPVGFGKLGDVYAVVQLRQDNFEASLYNLVGFQTNLKFGEQKRVFSMIPALHDAEFVKYGVMHRNTFINSPELLDETYNLKNTKIFFAGQISGVEGYVESIASGLVASLNAISMFNRQNGELTNNKESNNLLEKNISNCEKINFSCDTIIGVLAKYISTPQENFQPMNANFGLFSCEKRFKSKQEKYEYYANRSIDTIKKMIS